MTATGNTTTRSAQRTAAAIVIGLPASWTTFQAVMWGVSGGMDVLVFIYGLVAVGLWLVALAVWNGG